MPGKAFASSRSPVCARFSVLCTDSGTGDWFSVRSGLPITEHCRGSKVLWGPLGGFAATAGMLVPLPVGVTEVLGVLSAGLGAEVFLSFVVLFVFDFPDLPFTFKLRFLALLFWLLGFRSPFFSVSPPLPSTSTDCTSRDNVGCLTVGVAGILLILSSGVFILEFWYEAMACARAVSSSAGMVDAGLASGHLVEGTAPAKKKSKQTAYDGACYVCQSVRILWYIKQCAVTH